MLLHEAAICINATIGRHVFEFPIHFLFAIPDEIAFHLYCIRRIVFASVCDLENMVVCVSLCVCVSKVHGVLLLLSKQRLLFPAAFMVSCYYHSLYEYLKIFKKVPKYLQKYIYFNSFRIKCFELLVPRNSSLK